MERIARIRRVDGRVYIDLFWKNGTDYLPPPYKIIEVDEVVFGDGGRVVLPVDNLGKEG